MDPMSMFAAAKAVHGAHRGWKKADAEVAAAAEEQGISKEEAWAGVQAAVLMQARERLTDPLGWGAAARAYEQAERDRTL